MLPNKRLIAKLLFRNKKIAFFMIRAVTLHSFYPNASIFVHFGYD